MSLEGKTKAREPTEGSQSWSELQNGMRHMFVTSVLRTHTWKRRSHPHTQLASFSWLTAILGHEP